MRTYRALVLVLSFLMLASVFFVCISYAQPPPSGNWVVTGQEVVENTTIALNGNLTVIDGGSLTLTNVNLSLNVQYDDQYGISVQEGGSLYVYNSTIAPSNPEYRFTFDVNGSNFVMKGSTLSGIGRCNYTSGNPAMSSQDYSWGLRVWTDNSVLEDNEISGSAIGLILIGSGETAINNTLSGNDVSALALFGSNDEIEWNSLQQNATSTLDSAIINGAGIQNDTIFGNSIAETQLTFSLTARMDGIDMYDSLGIEIVNNTIYASNQALQLHSSEDLVIENNTLTFGENGITIWLGCVNSRIEGNSLQALELAYGSGFPTGIVLNLADNSIIAGNRLSGNLSQAIWLDHTANSSVLNNYVDSQLSTDPSMSQTSILLSSSTNNTLSDNELSGTFRGIIVYGSSDGNTISGNNVSAGTSIIVDGSSRNVIYGNDFHDFTSGGPYDDGNNSWYLQDQGNYWSHYTGADEYGDGTGDSPYVRTAIPPNGSEPYSTQTAFPLVPAAIPTLSPAPLPIFGGGPRPGSVIENQVLELDYGYLPSNLTIINSTLILGLQGPVLLLGSITVLGSEIIGVGYGWSIAHSSIVAVDSQLIGGSMQDLDVDGGVISIENSTIADSQLGFGITGGAPGMSISLVNDTFSGPLWPVRFGWNGASNIIIENNTFVSSLGFAIVIWGATGNNVSIIGNTIQRGWGIGVAFGGNGAVIRDNTFSNCAVGLAIPSGANNIIYHNNFINDTINAGSPPGNQWSYEGEGNYWGGYTGRDANFTGIGDTPYTAPGTGITDSYPFIEPDGWLTTFYLAVNTTSPYVPFSINGTAFTTGPDGTVSLRLGYVANYNISFNQDVPVSEGIRLGFLQWSDRIPSANRTLNLSANSTVQVSYMEQYQLTIRVSPSGKGSTEPSGSSWVDEHGIVNITATPVQGWNFTGWSGDTTGTANPTQVTMEGPKSITANFQGTPVPEFQGSLVFFTILVGVLIVVLVERRLGHQQRPV
jgi:parallel beta-helix repeat protein